MPGATFDAGPITADSAKTISHRFELVNRSYREIHILGEHHSCSCTQVEISKNALAPGAGATLTMTANVSRGFGKRTLSCVVETDDPRHPEWPFHLEYESLPRSRITPEQLDLGTFSLSRRSGHPGGPLEAWLEVYGPASEAKLSVPAKVVAPEDLVVDLASAGRHDLVAGGIQRMRYRLQVRLKSGDPSQGTFARQVDVSLDDGSSATTLAIWKVVGPLTASPSQVHFGMVAPGGPLVSRSLTIRTNEGRKFRVLSVASGSPNLIVMASWGAGFPTPSASFHVFVLEFRPAANAPGLVHSGTLQIVTDTPHLGTVRVPWSVFYRRPSSPAAGENRSLGEVNQSSATSRRLQ